MSGTRLPGGDRISFRGYLPDKTCAECHKAKSAELFLKMERSRSGHRRLGFSATCIGCGDRFAFPPDLLPFTLTQTFYGDDGRPIGWRQRTRLGPFGPELPLTMMQFRRSNGVIIPQPKLDRRSAAAIAANPRPERYGVIGRDSRRSIRRVDLWDDIRKQHGLCKICGESFTTQDPAVGGHDFAHSKGGSSRHESNHAAVHRSCNAIQGDRTFAEARAIIRRARQQYLPL